MTGPGDYNLNTVRKRFHCVIEEVVQEHSEGHSEGHSEDLLYRVFGADKRKVADAASRVRELGRKPPRVSCLASWKDVLAISDEGEGCGGRRPWDLGRHSDADVAKCVGTVLCPAAPAMANHAHLAELAVKEAYDLLVMAVVTCVEDGADRSPTPAPAPSPSFTPTPCGDEFDRIISEVTRHVLAEDSEVDSAVGRQDAGGAVLATVDAFLKSVMVEGRMDAWFAGLTPGTIVKLLTSVCVVLTPAIAGHRKTMCQCSVGDAWIEWVLALFEAAKRKIGMSSKGVGPVRGVGGVRGLGEELSTMDLWVQWRHCADVAMLHIRGPVHATRLEAMFPADCNHWMFIATPNDDLPPAHKHTSRHPQTPTHE